MPNSHVNQTKNNIIFMTPAEENALKLEVTKLREENELIKKLSSLSGFFEYYFQQCRSEKYRTEAFEKANETYRQLFGKERFPSHESFKMALNRFYKNKK